MEMPSALQGTPEQQAAALLQTVTEENLSTSEQSLEKRFRRIPQKREDVVYEFTRDPAMIQQYYALLEVMYPHTFRKYYGEPSERISPNACDKTAIYAIARSGKQCLGGCRVNYHYANESNELPMEENDFRIPNALKEVNLVGKNYFEASRFAIMEDEYQYEMLFELSSVILDAAVRRNMHYIFVRAEHTRARLWRKVAAMVGFINPTVRYDIETPPLSFYPEVKHYLGYAEVPELTETKTVLLYTSNMEIIQ